MINRILPKICVASLSVSILTACSGSDGDGSIKATPKPQDTASGDELITPATTSTNVSGAFLFAFACDVVNGSDADATETTFGCTLKDEQGAPVPGVVEAKSAAVATKGGTEKTEATITPQPAGGGYQFAIVAKGVKPSAAASLVFKAVYQGKEHEFVYLVPAAYLTKTTGDLELYVDGAAGDDAGLCAQAAPCRTISRAVALVPDQIAHAIVIHVLASATYEETVKIANRGVSTGRLEIRGEPGPAGELRPVVSHADGVIEVRNMRSPAGGVTIRNFEVRMPSAAGNTATSIVRAAIRAFDSPLDLADLMISGPSAGVLAALALARDPTGAEVATMYEVSGHGVSSTDGGSIRLRGPVVIEHFGTAIVANGSRFAIQASLTIRECFRGIVAAAGAILGANSVGLEEGLPVERFEIAIDAVNSGISVSDGSNFNIGNDVVASMRLRRGDVKNTNTTGLTITDSGTFRFAVREIAADFEVDGFEKALNVNVNAAATFNLSPPATEPPVPSASLFALKGCRDTCLFANGGVLGVRAGTVSISTSAVTAATATALTVVRAATVDFNFDDALLFDLPPPLPVEAHPMVRVNDRSTLSIIGTKGAQPIVAPSTRMLVGGASTFQYRDHGGPLFGASSNNAAICNLPSWDYTAAPVNAACIEID